MPLKVTTVWHYRNSIIIIIIIKVQDHLWCKEVDKLKDNVRVIAETRAFSVFVETLVDMAHRCNVFTLQASSRK